jgi:hypothetical protein
VSMFEENSKEVVLKLGKRIEQVIRPDSRQFNLKDPFWF